jgi:hypothetical protein
VDRLCLRPRHHHHLKMSNSFQRKATHPLRALEALGLWSRRVDSRRLQVILIVELMIGIAYLLFMMVSSAGRPVVAIGIVFQAVAGLLAATRIWANSATDSAIKWTAGQIEKNRFGFIGFFDGSPRSLAITLSWCCVGAFCAGAAPTSADGILDWMFVVFAAVAVWSGVLIFLFAMLAFSARTILIGVGTPPDGAVLRALGNWLTARDWVWSMVGLLIFTGCLLQLTAT